MSEGFGAAVGIALVLAVIAIANWWLLTQ